jgi:hypothetical protein
VPLQGFGNPLSPSGEAALVDQPPHHISADAIQIIYTVDPDRASAYLPEGLELNDPPLGYAYLADMTKVSARDPDVIWRDPQRSMYNEGIVGLYCNYRGEPGRFSSFVWVDRDWSVVFGHYMGFAKKQATVHKTRIQPANPAMAPVAAGTRIGGTVERQGRRVMEMSVRLAEQLPDDSVPSYGHRVYTYRHLPSPSPEVPSSRQLLALDLESATTINCWRADDPKLELFDVPNEELAGLRPVEFVDAFAFQRGWTTSAGAKLLRDDSE